MSTKKKNQNSDRVVELLQDAISTRIERNGSYGESSYGGCYKQHGPVMERLFPEGIELSGSNDLSRYAILDTIVGKLIRYANNFHNGGHDDSLKDISVYANMLRELDEIPE